MRLNASVRCTPKSKLCRRRVPLTVTKHPSAMPASTTPSVSPSTSRMILRGVAPSAILTASSCSRAVVVELIRTKRLTAERKTAVTLSNPRAARPDRCTDASLSIRCCVVLTSTVAAGHRWTALVTTRATVWISPVRIANVAARGVPSATGSIPDVFCASRTVPART